MFAIVFVALVALLVGLLLWMQHDLNRCIEQDSREFIRATHAVTIYAPKRPTVVPTEDFQARMDRYHNYGVTR